MSIQIKAKELAGIHLGLDITVWPKSGEAVAGVVIGVKHKHPWPRKGEPVIKLRLWFPITRSWNTIEITREDPVRVEDCGGHPTAVSA